MVQYVFTPWRDRQELLLVRSQLYPDDVDGAAQATTSGSNLQRLGGGGGGGGGPADEQKRHGQHLAVARVSMWMQRGNCPHMVESTALLMAALLNDDDAVAAGNAASSTYAVRAAYSAAFSRFVTGLLDGHQDKQRKQSMYAIAKTIGLPATFVELRHQSTHEQLPSLAKLRSAARKALSWIWDYYWRQLGDEDEDEDGDACKEAVLAYLKEDDETRARRVMQEQVKVWSRARVLETVKRVQSKLPGNKVFLRCTKLERELMDMDMDMDMDMEAQKGAHEADEDAMVTDIETGHVGESQPQRKEEEHEAEDKIGESTKQGADPMEADEHEHDDDDIGWFQFEGPWKPKPIGMV